MLPSLTGVDVTTVVAGLLSIAFAYASVIGNAEQWVTGSFVLFGLVLVGYGIRRGYRTRPTADELKQ